MVLILVDHKTTRIEYTFDFVFGQRDIEFNLTTDDSIFELFEGPKINYSNSGQGSKICEVSTLLYSDELWKGKLQLAQLKSQEIISFGGVPDLFASIFFVLTRMEEYAVAERDEHQRFPFKRSIQNEFGWIDKAICDRWASFVIEEEIGLTLKKEVVNVIPTFDIDNTYAYKLKDGKRKLLSTLKDVSKLDSKRLKERKRVLKGDRDPYDTFDKIRAVASSHSKTKLFWLTRSNGEKDRNIPLSNKLHQDLIKDLSQAMQVNIHPSYDSFGKAEEVRSEIDDLSQITQVKIDSSRQHFLRFQLPETFKILMESGIRNEYSMGFAESPGFRSGTARSHAWFDLTENKSTDLIIHPFVYMDGTLLEYKGYSIEESKTVIKELYTEIENYGGNFVFLWHNETIGDYGKWNGWSEVLDYTLKLKNE